MWRLPTVGLVVVSMGIGAAAQTPVAVLDAANLVPDGGFESKKFCPSDYNQQRLRTLANWEQPTEGTPDHFASCSGSAAAGVPINRFGEEPGLEGNAYGGLVVFSRAKWRYREYLSTELKRSLAPKEWVCVSFWYSAAEKAGVVADGIGALLSADKPSGERDYILDYVPQMQNPRGHFLEASTGWVKLSDAVQAEGGERWLTLGNFDAKGETRLALSADAPKDASDWAYVYMDGVEVVPVDAPEDCACLVRKIELEMQDPPEPLTRVEELERDTLHFDFDDATLQKEDMAKLERWGSMLRRNRFLRLEVHGHTDATGPEGYNSVLSKKRADTAFEYLLDIGVAPDRMRTTAHGSQWPTATNANDLGRAKNRRVEFRLVEQAFLEVD